MREHEAIAVLERRVDLLRRLAAIAVDPEADTWEAYLAQRQQIIDALQQLDASVGVLRRMRAEKWPSFSAQGARRCEELALLGNELLAGLLERGSVTIEKIRENRATLSQDIHRVRKMRQYHPAALKKRRRPSIIVSDHL